MKAIAEDKAFGRVEELDEVAKKFGGAPDKAAVVAEAESVVADLKDEAKTNGALYISYMKKVRYVAAQYAMAGRVEEASTSSLDSGPHNCLNNHAPKQWLWAPRPPAVKHTSMQESASQLCLCLVILSE